MLGLRDKKHFRLAYLTPALATGYLERTIPDKPHSNRQRYRLTESGQAWVIARKKERKEDRLRLLGLEE